MSRQGLRSTNDFVRRQSDIISNTLGVPLFGLSDQERHDHALRLAWSLAGRRMLASLFDETESGEGKHVSVFHTKRAFSETYAACLAMFLPETDGAPDVLRNDSDIADEAFSTYLGAGFFRKSPYWVKSAPPSCSCCDLPSGASKAKDFQGMFLLRGIGPGLQVGMSGLGPWMTETKWKAAQTLFGVDILSKSPVDFLNLHTEQIEDGWNRLVCGAQWQRNKSNDLNEYRIFCFTSHSFGLWKNFSETQGLFSFKAPITQKNAITLAYFQQNDKPKTFLLRQKENDFELSPLSDTDALRSNEWLLAASRSNGTAPLCTVKPLFAALSEYEWCRGGRHAFVQIRLSMRPSEQLEAFLKVYSWPAEMDSPNPWSRIMPAGIFTYFHPLLLREGFRVEQQNITQQ